MRHRHADLIHAYAEGAKIQIRSGINGNWADLPVPDFSGGDMAEYRIKPEPRPDVVRSVQVYNDVRGGTSLHWNVLDEYANLRLTFDGETGKLKAAEVIA